MISEIEGEVVRVHTARGFAFVMTAETRDQVFAHRNQFEYGHFELVKCGSRVALQLGVDRSGRVCGENVRLLDVEADEPAPRGYLAGGAE